MNSVHAIQLLVSTRNSRHKEWLCETRGKMERFSVESCMGGYHVYKAQTLLVLAYLHESASENFMGGKFHDAGVSHENNEN